MIGGKRDRDFEEDEDNTVEAGDKFQRPKIYPLSADTSTSIFSYLSLSELLEASLGGETFHALANHSRQW